jgi:hypothetical protein
MKYYRLVKYKIKHNDPDFSNTITDFKVLPVIEQIDTAKPQVWATNTLKLLLLSYADDNGLTVVDSDPELSRFYNNITTVVVRLADDWGLAFAEMAIPSFIVPSLDCTGVLTEEQACEIIDMQWLGVIGQATIDREDYIIMGCWEYFRALRLLGYDHKQFEAIRGATDRTFDDEVFQCTNCSEYDWNDSGYTYNYRIVDCEQLGVNCGCYEEHQKENWKDRIDDTETPIELDLAEQLETDGKIEFIERFIGGMVDGRGGYYGGEAVRESDPKTVLAELKKSEPDSDFIFSHDESGQFQTYFSVWRVVGVKKKTKSEKPKLVS